MYNIITIFLNIKHYFRKMILNRIWFIQILSSLIGNCYVFKFKNNKTLNNNQIKK